IVIPNPRVLEYVGISGDDCRCYCGRHQVLKAARERFTQEISFQSKDKDISLANVLLYVAAEDEAFLALNRELDAEFLSKERRSASVSSDAQKCDSLDNMPMSGRTISQWLSELASIAKEVEAELISRDIGCHLVEVLEAVNVVFLDERLQADTCSCRFQMFILALCAEF
ncbi:hypothetical protein EUGRSUZ_D02550, partial [Eucalyptus grandis]